MNYLDNDLIKNLSNTINSANLKRKNYYNKDKVLETDYIWQSSVFFSKIIFNASTGNLLTVEEFNKFKTCYENKNKLSIDCIELFDKYWLRTVFDIIKIPSSIRSFCHTFDNISSYREELKFLIQLQKSNNSTKADSKNIIEKTVLNDRIIEYEKLNGLSLDLKGVLFECWSIEKENHIEFSDIEFYYKPYYDNWKDFLFLTALNKHLKSSNNLLIKTEVFDKLYTSHKNYYSKIPSVEEFIDQKLLVKINDQYKIDFYNSEIRYSELENKISGYLWQLMLEDKTFINDHARLKTLVNKTIYGEGMPNPFKYINSQSKSILLNAAFNAVITENDIEGCEDEFKKIRLEGENRNNIYIISERAPMLEKEFTLKKNNLFEILESLNSWEENAQISYLHDQTSRLDIGYLIYLIVSADEEFHQKESSYDEQFEIQHFPKVKELLRSGINKPYAVWKIFNCIKYHRAEIIPYLLIEKDLCSICFILIDELEFNPEDKSYFKTKIWKQTIGILLKNCIALNYSQQEIAKIVFDLYKIVNKDKYDFNLYKADQTNYRHELIDYIENFRIETNYHRIFKNGYLLPQIFNDLSILFIDLETRIIYNNGTIRFPMLQWDGMFWLLKISAYWKYRSFFESAKTQRVDLVEKFHDSYIETLETNEIIRYDFIENKDVIAMPLWSEKIEKVGFLEWLYPIYFINENGDLSNFLSPRLKFSKNEKDYKQHLFIAGKLRTHAGVLLQVLKNIIETPAQYGLKQDKIQDIKTKIENQIIDYIKRYSKDDIKSGNLDLFDFNKEWAFQKSEKEALLPQLGRAINYFSDKEKIIDTILNSGDLSKILIILENVTSEGTRKILLSRIKSIDIRNFLKKYNWIPEIQNVLLKLSKYRELAEQTEEAVTYWEEEILKRRDKYEYKVLLFKTKLLLAYFRNDLTEINSIKLPEKENFSSHNELPYSEYKKFYTALFYIESDAHKSYVIFNELCNRYPSYSSFAVNRLIAKANWAEREHNLDIYREALEEWKEYKKIEADSDLSLDDPDESLSILDILNKLGKNEEIEKIYQNLDLTLKMNQYILKIRIHNLIKQKKIDEAEILKEKAKKYHGYDSELELDFIFELENLISEVDNIDQLKQYYDKVFRSNPEKLIKVFPENINGKHSLNEFIVHEIVIASDKMLEKIKSISEIRSEDKYNDILEVILDARINQWGWHVGSQSRGGFSAPKKGKQSFQPGERDLVIMNKYKHAMQICEAFIYRGAKTAKDHIKKVFDYHHKKESIIVIAYCAQKVNTKTFDENWQDYLSKIVPYAEYPSGYEFVQITDVTADYKMKLSAIKIASSTHNSGTVLHHIFININYKTV